MYNQGKIMRRLLGRPTNDSTASDNNLGHTGSPIPPTFRPNASQDVDYTAGGPIACLDKSPDGKFAVLGGRHILKTIQIDGSNIKEGIDLRAIITSQPNTKPGTSTTVSDQLSIKDVKWAINPAGESVIFTACANGRIFQYNLTRLGSRPPGGLGLEFVQAREDSRQINTLDINPHKSSWLLSGSQDGIVRCFDTRDWGTTKSGQGPHRAFKSFRCNAEGIRDVQWSPKDGFIFACATESGAVFKWDIRKTSAPLLRINAHDPTRGVSCIAWHFDGESLLSAGLDNAIHVWDVSDGADKRQKPKWTISTPAPVTCVSWRPALRSVSARGRRAAQIAVSYVDGPTKGYGISPVHVWDFGRPTMPFKAIDRFEYSPNVTLWQDQDLLWTVGLNGFSQCDVAYAPKVVDRRPTSALAFAPRGHVLMVLEERAPSRKPHPAIATQDMLPSSFSSSPNAQVLSHSRSDSEEDVVGSFLGPSKLAGRRPSANASSRPAASFSTTPPSGTDEPVMPLSQSIGITQGFKPSQVMAIGQVTASSKSKHYLFLSRHYLETLYMDLPHVEGGSPLNVRVCGIMEHWARAAESIGQIRLAQTWRVLAPAFNHLLNRRAQYHLELRMARRKNAKSPMLKARSDSKLNLQRLSKSAANQASGDETSRKTGSVGSVETRHSLAPSLLSGEADSESNVPTPIARPIREDMPEYHQYVPGKVLTPVKELDSFTLPPASYKGSERPGLRQRHDSAPLSVISQDTHISQDSQISSTEGYDFYDVDAVDGIPQAIDVPKKKEPLSLDYVDAGPSSDRRPQPERHDSDESFGQIFSVSDGGRLPTETSSVAGSLRRVASHPVGMVGSNTSSVEEYQSRIRGKQIPESTGTLHPAVSQDLVRHDSDSSRDIFMISQTTADSGDSQVSQEGYHDLSHRSPHPSPIQLRVKEPQSPRKHSHERLASDRPEESTSTVIIEADFMPWEDDPPYPFPLSKETDSRLTTPSIDPYEMLSRALSHETRSSALNASAMILLLRPLVPEEVIDHHQATAILRHHHDRLMRQKYFVEAATLRNVCVPGWNGLDEWGDNYTSIFHPAQDPQRVSASFTCPNCHKPREINRGENNMGIWKCERCGYAMGPCVICGHRDATVVSNPPMEITRGLAQWRESRESSILQTWWYCLGCKHGGHAACIEAWHSPLLPDESDDGDSLPGPPAFLPEPFSEGCCPADGCGHACLPGRWRDALSNAKKEPLERKVREQTRSTIPTFRRNDHKVEPAGEVPGSAPAVIGGVRSDAVVVSQSRAVEGAREVLAVPESGNVASIDDGTRLTRAAGGILSVLSSSPGRSNVQGPVVAAGIGNKFVDKNERERRKSVKFAGAPDGRR
ncbi:hypothetical protein BKA67DRAFT_655480 [Truncatella angustata]|uniref:Uncharacterized protein n=1 Tax=Truncatella angustata TaxID=152316 RepID=A0A9P8URU0_9PEZI|nr:uncharacterized protein BKA67DRAFT_655480 [Truncatella angustata]KAH6657194.1 hypothetical protein BKA67DRAFT_655480 [Truncatella angustata]